MASPISRYLTANVLRWINGDGRGESDCLNVNVLSTIRYIRNTRIGESVEYKFDFRLDPGLEYKGWYNMAATGYYPESWDSQLRLATWEGEYLHNFIYILKADKKTA